MRILAVDDDRGTRNIIFKLLTDQHYEVDVAADGPSALEMVRRNHYDLVILDYEMPFMNGVELFGLINKLKPKLVGIFLTAYTRIDTIYPAVEAGISRVLAKPVNNSELIATIEELGKGPLMPA